MAGQDETAAIRARFVPTRKRPHRPRTVDTFKVPLGRQVTAMPVVIPPHQNHFQSPVPFAPFCQSRQHRGRASDLRMKKVTEDDQSSGFRGHQDFRQSLEIVVVGILRHGHASRAERRRLSKMRICDEDRPVARPPDRALRQKREGLAGPIERSVPGSHARDAAASSSSVIRRTRSLHFSVLSCPCTHIDQRGNERGVSRSVRRKISFIV